VAVFQDACTLFTKSERVSCAAGEPRAANDDAPNDGQSNRRERSPAKRDHLFPIHDDVTDHDIQLISHRTKT